MGLFLILAGGLNLFLPFTVALLLGYPVAEVLWRWRWYRFLLFLQALFLAEPQPEEVEATVGGLLSLAGASGGASGERAEAHRG